MVRRSSASWPRTPPRARWRPGPGVRRRGPSRRASGTGRGRAARSNSGATLTNDFIELANAGSGSLDLSGYTVQY
ncbi:hypothetical protein ACFC63_15640, partial [Streptomyces albidoflavus]